MATPTLKTLEAEAADSTDPTVSPKLRNAGGQVAPTDAPPLVSPKLRVSGANVAKTGTPPLVSPKLRVFGAQIQVDPSPPTVSLDAPTTGPLIGSILMEATASDAFGTITQVDFLVDGSPVNTDTTAPYEYLYDTTSTTDGPHNFQARATNSFGLTTTTPDLYLVIDNSPPTISLDSPSVGYLTGSELLEATAADPHSGITLVEFLVDGLPVGSDTTMPYNYLYDTTVLSDGPHNFQARATNGVSLQTTTAVLNLTVDNSPPACTYLNPITGTVSGEVLMQADASDAHSGVERVDFMIDSVVVGQDFIPDSPYSFSFPSTTLSNGPHNFQATAYNGAGLSTTTPTNNIVVNNTLPPPPAPALDCDLVQEPVSDVAVRANHVFRAMTNFLSLLSDDDQEILTRLWGGMQQFSEDLYLQLYQNYDSKNIFRVPVFRRSRWNEIILNFNAQPAKIYSTKANVVYDTSIATGDNTLTFIIDGNAVAVTFTDSANNPIPNVMQEINDAAAAVLNRPNLVVAINDGYRIILQSLDVGENATISIDPSDGNIELGFFPGITSVGRGTSTRAEPAQIVSSNSPPLVDTSVATGEPTMRVRVDGGPIKIITFPNDPSTTIITIVDSINSVVPGLASLDPVNRVILTSPTTTCDSSIQIPTGGGHVQLGFTEGDIAYGCGIQVDEVYPQYPISYEIRVGIVDDELKRDALTDPSIMSIPALRSRIDGPRVVLGQADKPHEGSDDKETNFGTGLRPDAGTIDSISSWDGSRPNHVESAFLVRNGRIHFDKNVDTQMKALCLDQMWAEDVYRNDTYLKDNFGFPIQYERDNSIEYKNVLQGLHKAYWSGPQIKDAEVGLNLLFDLPTAPASGKIQEINTLQNPEILGIEASQYFDIRGVNRTFSFTIDGVFVFVVFARPGTGQSPDPVPENGVAVSQQNYPAVAAAGERSIINDINAAALAAGLGFQPASAYIPDISQPDQVQIRLTGLQSVRIDTVTGNAAIGFPPGNVAFGLTEIVINNVSYEISTEFPITKQAGDIVERLDPLTDGVEILDYVSDPIWWEVFGLACLDSRFSVADGYTKEDLKLINEILKYHLFGVKIIPDAFNRLGNIEFGVVSKFINDIKPLTKNYILLIPFLLLDVFTLTDDSDLDGRPDDVEDISLVFPPNLDVPPYNLLEFAANLPYGGANPPPVNKSFSDSYPLSGPGGWTRAAVVAGTSPEFPYFLDMDSYNIHMVNGGSVLVMTGGYQAAEYIGTASGPFDTSGETGISINVNGFTVIIGFGSGAGQIPLGTSVSAHDVASAINAEMELATPGYGEASVTQDQKLIFRSHRTDGLTPTIQMNSAHAALGIATTGVLSGTAGTLVDEVPF